MITLKLWQTYLPGEPPPNCTYAMFSAAREYVWAEEDKEHHLKRLDTLRELWSGTNSETFKKLIEIEGKQIKGGL